MAVYTPTPPGYGGLSSLLRGRRNQVLQARGLPPRRLTRRPIPQRPTIPPPGGKHGGLLGYRNGGRTGTPRAAGFLGGSGDPRKLIERYKERSQGRWPRPFSSSPPGGWQEGGPVGAAPEEVEMAAEIYARATPEQQAQITGGGGPGMMDEEAAIGEALAMAMGGGGGPPMNGGPPMGGMI